MISEEELNPKGHPLTGTLLKNFQFLLATLNYVRGVYGKPMVINRGYSTPEEQAEINPKCPHDAHVAALGADIKDEDKDFWNWCLDHMGLLEELGIYLESKAYTPLHTHLQLYPPQSGNRIFIP